MGKKPRGASKGRGPRSRTFDSAGALASRIDGTNENTTKAQQASVKGSPEDSRGAAAQVRARVGDDTGAANVISKPKPTSKPGSRAPTQTSRKRARSREKARNKALDDLIGYAPGAGASRSDALGSTLAAVDTNVFEPLKDIATDTIASDTNVMNRTSFLDSLVGGDPTPIIEGGKADDPLTIDSSDEEDDPLLTSDSDTQIIDTQGAVHSVQGAGKAGPESPKVTVKRSVHFAEDVTEVYLKETSNTASPAANTPVVSEKYSESSVEKTNSKAASDNAYTVSDTITKTTIQKEPELTAPGEDFISLTNMPVVSQSLKNTFEQFEEQMRNDMGSFDEPRGQESDSEAEDSSDASDLDLNKYPWMRRMSFSHRQSISARLTEEIKHFASYMSPTQKEVENRLEVFHRISSAARKRWPQEHLSSFIFGSFATNLFLPGSDVDMVIITDSPLFTVKSSLFQLSHCIRSSGISSHIEVIASARVPIIKIKDSQYGINVDISFGRTGGVQAVDNILGWLKDYPSIRPLALVIKQYLAKRRINEVRNGGLGGFSLICLIVSFLKNHPKISSGEIDPEENLGTLLIEFFEFYGIHFNYEELVIETTGDMAYTKKRLSGGLMDGPLPRKDLALAIRDPNDRTNNISRSSFNLRGIKNTFHGAFKILTAKCYDLHRSGFAKGRESILASIIDSKGVHPRGFETQMQSVSRKYTQLSKLHTRFDVVKPPSRKANRLLTEVAAVSLSNGDHQQDDVSLYHRATSSEEEDDEAVDRQSSKRLVVDYSDEGGESEDSLDVHTRNHFSKRLRVEDEEATDSRTSQVGVAASSKADRRTYWNSKSLAPYVDSPITKS